MYFFHLFKFESREVLICKECKINDSFEEEQILSMHFLLQTVLNGIKPETHHCEVNI